MSKKEWMKDGEWAVSWAPLSLPNTQSKTKHVKALPYTVTEEDKKYFNDKGYWLGPKLFTDDDIAILRAEFEKVFDGQRDLDSTPYEYEYWMKVVTKHHQNSKDVMKVNNSWWINSTIRSAVTSPSIGKIASELLNTPEIRLWHDQAIIKPGNSEDTSGNIGWHQDYGYWQVSSTPDMITAFVALQDTDLNNGCLRTITRSHKWGLLPESAAFFDKDLDKLKDKFSSYAKGQPWEDEPCVMKAGQVAFHHALTFHASGPNVTDKPRMALAIHMMPQDCRYRTGYGWHHNIRDLGPDAKEGDLFAGPAFPVLYRRPYP